MKLQPFFFNIKIFAIEKSLNKLAQNFICILLTVEVSSNSLTVLETNLDANVRLVGDIKRNKIINK